MFKSCKRAALWVKLSKVTLNFQNEVIPALKETFKNDILVKFAPRPTVFCVVSCGERNVRL